MQPWKDFIKPLRLSVVVYLLFGAVMFMGIGSPYIPHAFADGSPMPFAPGERLRFHLRWTVIPAGKAHMEVLPMETIDGVPVYHFRLTAKSNPFVDVFYKVRDRIDAYASADMTHAVRYRHKQHEGDTRRNVEVEFDRKNDKAYYRDGKTNKKIDIIPGTFDPLSVFYYTRMIAYKQNDVIQCPVSDGKKCVYGVARIVKKESITVIAGTYETFLIEPDLKHVGGVFEKDKNATIKLWVTADERHIPVKIASKVAIGSFVGELAAIENSES
jgi:hypothetical protein